MASKNDPSKTLKEILARPQFPAGVLLVCPDRIRSERVIKNILPKVLPVVNENYRSTENLQIIDASQLSVSKLTTLKDETLSLSLFANERVFLLQNVNEMSAAHNQPLLDLLIAAPLKTYFILCAEKLPANAIIYKHFAKQNTLIELEALKGFDLQRWVQKELKTHGIESWQEEVPEAIIQSTEGSPDQINSLVEKLAIYLEGGNLNLAELAQLAKHAPDINEFNLVEILGGKPSWKPEILLTHILESGKSPFALLALLARNYQNYLQIAVLREKGQSAGQIRQSLALPPWLFNKQFEASKRFSSKRLRDCLDAILVADATLKNRSLGPEAIFSELSYRLNH